MPHLDLLPKLTAYMAQHNLKPKDLFLDYGHLSIKGSKVVAESIVASFHNTPSIWNNLMVAGRAHASSEHPTALVVEGK